MELFIHLLFGVWATVIVTRSHLFSWFRNWGNKEKDEGKFRFSECPLCVGTWMGVVSIVALWSDVKNGLVFPEDMSVHPLILLVTIVPAVSLVSHFVVALSDLLESKIWED